MIDHTQPTNRWQKAVSKFSSSRSTNNGSLIDCVKVRIKEYDGYLQEISQGKQIHNNIEYPMLRMTSEQLQEHQVIYDQSTEGLLNYNKSCATTFGAKSKGVKNLQAFVMSKEGALYIATHTGALNRNQNTLSHASFLGGRPAEMAGMISINKQGKISLITNDSGHYGPEALDMYRGIKKLQSLMPNVFTPDAIIQCHLGDKAHSYQNVSSPFSPLTEPVQKVSTFIEEMEKIGINGKPLHQELRDQRVAHSKKYVEVLKLGSAKSGPIR